MVKVLALLCLIKDTILRDVIRMQANIPIGTYIPFNQIAIIICISLFVIFKLIIYVRSCQISIPFFINGDV